MQQNVVTQDRHLYNHLILRIGIICKAADIRCPVLIRHRIGIYRMSPVSRDDFPVHTHLPESTCKSSRRRGDVVVPFVVNANTCCGVGQIGPWSIVAWMHPTHIVWEPKFGVYKPFLLQHGRLKMSVKYF